MRLIEFSDCLLIKLSESFSPIIIEKDKRKDQLNEGIKSWLQQLVNQ